MAQNRESLIVSVIGDGSWGTALALLLHDQGHEVRLWGAFPQYIETMRKTRENRKFLPGISLPQDLILTANTKDALRDTELIFSVVPTVYLRTVMEKFKPDYSSKIPIVSATKGIEQKSLLLPNEIIASVLGKNTPIAILAGPSHAEEVARGLPASVVVASTSAELNQLIQNKITSDSFRIYTSQDPIGVEIGGALKNILAIAAGICDGLGFGDNAKAALITRGIVEITRYGISRGAMQETFYGLTGIGDLLTTCYSKHSRNRSVGERLGRGESLQQILTSMEMIAEGITTTRAIYESNPSAEMPITAELYHIMFEQKNPKQAVLDLMRRTPREEVDGN